MFFCISLAKFVMPRIILKKMQFQKRRHPGSKKSLKISYDKGVFNNKKFLHYPKETYPSQLTVEKANKSDHLADYLDLTFIIDSGGKLSTRLYDKRDDSDFHIVNLHSFPATYHLALYLLYIFRSS